MRSRPIVFFAAIAVLMVGWLLARMWFGGWWGVWAVGCVLGAWAPLLAAAVFSYVAAVGDREHSVLAAWLVRAIGMHFVLVWMLGTSDWLRGPPGTPSGWNSDVGAPLVLALFAPTFALGYGLCRWVASLARRLDAPLLLPAMPGAAAGGPAPFRGVTLAFGRRPPGPLPLAPLALGAIACVAARGLAGVPLWLLPLVALVLAALAARNPRTIVAGVLSLTAVTVAILSRVPVRDGRALVGLGVAWPWLTAAALACYLVATEALVRSRLAPAH